MPRGYGNYQFVIDSSFRPFELQEMLVPFTAYKDAFEKAEEAYNNLTKEADTFKYLSKNLPEDSEARQIYEGYAKDLEVQARDLARNGLGMGNRRALTGLKQRYQGEIGRLVQADTAMKQEKELRRQLSAKDPSMLYATDNLTIDEFLDNKNPNLYNISGDYLYTRGAAAGQAASKRIFKTGDAGATLGGYFRDFVQRNGYTPEDLNKFGSQIMADFSAQVSVLPELQQAANQILSASGAEGNLTGTNLERARQQVIRGIIDGAVYTENHNPVRDPGVMSASERDSSARGWASFNLQKEEAAFNRAASGYVQDADGKWHYDPSRDLGVQKAAAITAAKGGGKSTGSKGTSSGGAGKKTISKQRVRLKWDGNDPAKDAELASNPVAKPVADDEDYVGTFTTFDKLPDYAKKMVMKHVGSGKASYYNYYFKPFRSGFFNDTEAEIDIVPRSIVTDASSFSLEDLENDSDLED